MRWRDVVLLSLALATTTLWVVKAELLATGTQVSESVPPIPALMWLLVALSTRSRAARAVYAVVAFWSFLLSAGAIRSVLPSLAVYVTENLSNPSLVAPAIPPPSVARQFLEGGGTLYGWLPCLAFWGAGLLLFYYGLLPLLSSLSKRWHETERLTPPLLAFPGLLQKTDKVFWIALAVTVALGACKVLNAFDPNVPTLKPMTVWGGLSFELRLSVVGLALLGQARTARDAALVTIASAFFCSALGYFPNLARFSLVPEHAAVGCYVAWGLVLLLGLRGWGQNPTRSEPCPPAGFSGSGGYRGANPSKPGLLGASLGPGLVSLGCFALWLAFILGPSLALPVALFLVLVSVVFWRLRCEVGLPSVWALPFRSGGVLFRLGTLPAATENALRGVHFLFRSYLLLGSAYLAELRTLAGQKVVRLTPILLVAGALLLVCWLGHTYGFEYLETIETGKGCRLALAREALVQDFSPSSLFRLNLGYGVGAVLLCLALKRRWFGCPSPAAFAIAWTVGYNLWGSLLTAWIVQRLIMVGGPKKAKVTRSVGLGLLVGDLGVAALWSLACILRPEWSDRLFLYFG